MAYIKSLKTVNRVEKDLCGQRATDLAFLQEKDFSVPLSFVLTNEAFEAFVEHNRLQQRIGEALTTYADKTLSYQLVREFLLNGKFPRAMVAEIVESYESLGAESDAPLDALIEAGSAPFVTVILSPNHALPEESMEGVVLNVRGLEELLLAVKECWACLFTPTMLSFREEAGIGEQNLNAGVIVQQMQRSEITGETWSSAGSNTKEVLAKAYYGAPDIGHDIPKDEWRLTREYLKPVYQRVAIQTEMLARDEDEKLGKQPIGHRGEEQTLTDRGMIELGRLAKKAAIALDCHVKLFFDIHDETYRLLLCDRLLLTKGSVKLQGYQAEERIEEGPAPEAAIEERPTPAEESSAPEEDPHLEEETASEEIPPDEETVEPDAAEQGTKHVVEEENFIVSVDEESGEETVEGKSEVVTEGGEEVEEPKDDSVEETDETITIVEENNEDAADEAEESPPDEEEKDSSPTNQEPEEDDSIFAHVIEKQEENKNVEEPVETEEEEKKEVAPDRTLQEAFDEVANALTKTYERRFRQNPPASTKDLFFELSEEVVLPHEELIGTLIMIHEEGREHDQEEEEQILEIIDEFLEQLRSE